MANKVSQKERKSVEKASAKTEQNPLKYAIKYFIINYIGLIILWPILDLIIAGISHKEFKYDVTAHLISPIFWALVLTVVEIFFSKNRQK